MLLDMIQWNLRNLLEDWKQLRGRDESGHEWLKLLHRGTFHSMVVNTLLHFSEDSRMNEHGSMFQHSKPLFEYLVRWTTEQSDCSSQLKDELAHMLKQFSSPPPPTKYIAGPPVVAFSSTNHDTPPMMRAQELNLDRVNRRHSEQSPPPQPRLYPHPQTQEREQEQTQKRDPKDDDSDVETNTQVTKSDERHETGSTPMYVDNEGCDNNNTYQVKQKYTFFVLQFQRKEPVDATCTSRNGEDIDDEREMQTAFEVSVGDGEPSFLHSEHPHVLDFEKRLEMENERMLQRFYTQYHATTPTTQKHALGPSGGDVFPYFCHKQDGEEMTG
ncbi:hypothetical protein RFI_12243 [Reticulomyxa filosa]|uniref:Uncharacterized protein n=1 Tax=Reticulomyxa filosa TaxID=46433 RepID=X6NGT5_RETFI|nr:hypothetical protein RFI_12243 [Reticulomyxa filosa]|eukprot:ETO24914.1 hypothetical protein RFI_12243 [Reticulomyxa filosa]